MAQGSSSSSSRGTAFRVPLACLSRCGEGSIGSTTPLSFPKMTLSPLSLVCFLLLRVQVSCPTPLRRRRHKGLRSLVWKGDISCAASLLLDSFQLLWRLCCLFPCLHSLSLIMLFCETPFLSATITTYTRAGTRKAGPQGPQRLEGRPAQAGGAASGRPEGGRGRRGPLAGDAKHLYSLSPFPPSSPWQFVSHYHRPRQTIPRSNTPIHQLLCDLAPGEGRERERYSLQ